MPYPKEVPFVVRLDELGAPELWAKFRDPWKLPAQTYKRVLQANVILGRARRDNEYPADTDAWALDEFDQYLKDTLVDWNLYDPDQYDPEKDPPEKQAAAIIPIKGNDDPFGKVPTDVFAFIKGKVMERLVEPPKSGD